MQNTTKEKAEVYEVNQHKNEQLFILERLKEAIETGKLDGLLVLKIYKPPQRPEFDVVFGRVTEFEWIGILDHLQDMIKVAHN